MLHGQSAGIGLLHDIFGSGIVPHQSSAKLQRLSIVADEHKPNDDWKSLEETNAEMKIIPWHKEPLNNSSRPPHPPLGRSAALAFGVNSTTIDPKNRLAAHPDRRRGDSGGMNQRFHNNPKYSTDKK